MHRLLNSATRLEEFATTTTDRAQRQVLMRNELQSVMQLNEERNEYDEDVHSLLRREQLDEASAQRVVAAVNNAIVELGMSPSAALVAAQRHHMLHNVLDRGVLALFGGQASAWFDDLRLLYVGQPSVRAFIDASLDALLDEATTRHDVDIDNSTAEPAKIKDDDDDFDVLSWFAVAERRDKLSFQPANARLGSRQRRSTTTATQHSIPSAFRLYSAPISLPMIFLTSLANVVAMVSACALCRSLFC